MENSGKDEGSCLDDFRERLTHGGIRYRINIGGDDNQGLGLKSFIGTSLLVIRASNATEIGQVYLTANDIIWV